MSKMWSQQSTVGCSVLFASVVVMSLAIPLYGQTFRYDQLPDERIWTMGSDQYNKQTSDFALSAIHLYAYIQRAPERMKSDPRHRGQVEKAFGFSVKYLMEAIAQRDSLRRELSKIAGQQGPIVSGIEEKPRLDRASGGVKLK